MFIYDLDLPALSALLKASDEPPYRAGQIWQGLYRDIYDSWSQFSSLPTPLRQRMQDQLALGIVDPVVHVDSADACTRKSVFRLHDGLKIETVLMRYDKRQTLCISSQAGCAMGCVFCATGQMGFQRNLSAAEIIGQVMYYARLLKLEGRKLTNIVVMGMGEPFHNYENLMAAIDRLNDPDGFHFGARRFTISTVGLAPQIRRFADEKRQVNLAISLHAAEDRLRLSMLPVNRKYGIEEVLDACRYYIDQTGRRVTIEWALISGVNDTPEQARMLAARVHGILCHVNAIPLNPTAGYAGTATSRARAVLFKEELERAGVPCTIRLRRGIEIAAGCGQLVC
jgi:23S rRNA (adenine2503-C2)-methyltransferase